MNKKLTVLVLGLFLSGVTMAQDSPTKNKIIKTNPIGLAFGNINLTYEMALSNATSFQVGGNFFTKILGTEVSGFGINGGFRYYITNATKPAPQGFYVGPRVAYNSFTEKSTDEKATTLGIGALIGYQWIFGSGVTLDLGAGPTYLFASDSSTTGDFTGIIPNITFAIGFNF